MERAADRTAGVPAQPKRADPVEGVEWDGRDDFLDSDTDGHTPSAGDTVSTAAAETDPLGERGRAILTFERRWWRHAGAKEQAIRDEFGLSATRYYQLLNGLLDVPAALERDPVLVGRLRRLRAARGRSRRTRD